MTPPFLQSPKLKTLEFPFSYFSTVSQKPFSHQTLQLFLSIISYMAPFPFIPITTIPILILNTSHLCHSLLCLLVTRFSSLQKNRETNKTGHQINTLKPTQKSMVLHYILSQVKTLCISKKQKLLNFPIIMEWINTLVYSHNEAHRAMKKNESHSHMVSTGNQIQI